MQSFDVIVIGGGPAGYVAAIRCAQLKLKTAVVEREHLGGVCLNWGCIPTKALLRSAEVKHLIDHADAYGLKTAKAEIDLPKIVKRSRDISGQLSSGIKHLLKKNGVTHIEGHGRLDGPTKIIVDKNGKKETYATKHVILATGARARTLPNLDVGKHIWTARHAMTPETLPKSLVIIGSGAIGIEFASFYNTLGVKVTVVEMLDRILPAEDPEISKLALESFKKQGIEFYLSTSLEKVDETKTGVKAHLKNADKETVLEADKLLLAIGIVGNTEDLGLTTTKIQMDRTQIKIDCHCRTNEPTIFAVGDVVGAPWLAHKGSHEGILAAETIAGLKTKPMKKDNIPGCTYSMPQIASIGLSEAKAMEYTKAQNDTIKIGRFPFMANGKALAMGEGSGLVKLIFAKKTGELLGAHMIGAEVTELIHSMALCKTLEATEEDIMHTIFPHPTLSEMLHEAALAADGKVIHF
ncbi:MAG: dihydrolipoyl dehydrogenase [Alphaproteobacteria bacterium]|nr:dihydrolipoyl dehydrogenase [Alphaproteobacteria bacterium]